MDARIPRPLKKQKLSGNSKMVICRGKDDVLECIKTETPFEIDPSVTHLNIKCIWNWVFLMRHIFDSHD
jgi:hypothetical protein